MSEAKHTPGPWKAERMLLTPRAKDRRSGFVVNEENDTREFGTRICDLRVPSGAEGFREGEANARLIAAAPDLLAACSEFIRVIDALREVNVLGDWPVVREAVAPIRAAIAKART